MYPLPQIRIDFRSSNSDVSPTEAILYASGMVFLNGIGVLTINQLFMVGYHNGMKARIAVCSIIYRKVSGTISPLRETSVRIFMTCKYRL